MSDIVDLDALAPENITIKLGNQEYIIEPPDLEDVMLLGAKAQKMAKFSGEDLNEASNNVKSVTDQLNKCVPALAGKKLTVSQMMVLVKIITEMSTPPDVKELKARGIELGGEADPKDPSAPSS